MSINFSDSSKSFNEGMINDVLKATSDIDVEDILGDWRDTELTTVDAIKGTDEKGLSKASDLLDKVNAGLNKKRINSSSIVARARKSVLQFPIYISQGLRVNEAHIIAKLFERVYTSLVQTVLAQNPIMNEEEANDLVFLKNFHTNIKESADLYINEFYQPIDELDRIMQESVFYSEQITPTMSVQFRWVPPTNKDLLTENARLLNEPLSGLSYLKEEKEKMSDSVTKNHDHYVYISDKDLEEMAKDRLNLSSKENDLLNKSDKDIEASVRARYTGTKDEDDYEQKVKEAANRMMKEKDALREKLNDEVKAVKQDIKNKKIKHYSFDGAKYRHITSTIDKIKTDKEVQSRPTPAVDTPKILKESDIKKINGMLPFTIEAHFTLKSKDGSSRDVKYLIGVKSVLHAIRLKDLSEDLRELVTGDVKTLQKIRYKTGEIGFLDYIFNIKGIKSDAAKHVNYNKRWINTLKRLAEYDKMHGTLLKNPTKLLTGGNVPIPNGTLILAETDISTLKTETGIDLNVVANVKRLAKSLFLIAVAVVDGSAGTMKVLFTDTDNQWDVQSLASIDAEIAKTDNSQIMKELNRMVNR